MPLARFFLLCATQNVKLMEFSIETNFSKFLTLEISHYLDKKNVVDLLHYLFSKPIQGAEKKRRKKRKGGKEREGEELISLSM